MPAANRDDGAVLVEFALVLVPLLLLLVGMLQFGLALNAKIDETHLTAEAARYAAVNQNPGSGLTPPTLQRYIRTRADTTALQNSAVVCVEYPTNTVTGTSGNVGDPVRVTMTYSYALIPFLGSRLNGAPTSLPVNSEATMRLEAIPTNIPAGCA
jgi:Flp pilus assembly protein TadG